MHPLTANAAQQTQPREDGVYRTLTDGEDARAVGHNDVLALADHRKPGLFEGADGIEMIDARNFWQG